MYLEEALTYVSRTEEDVASGKDPSSYMSKVIEAMQLLIDEQIVWRMFATARDPYYYQKIAHHLIRKGICRLRIRNQ